VKKRSPGKHFFQAGNFWGQRWRGGKANLPPGCKVGRGGTAKGVEGFPKHSFGGKDPRGLFPSSVRGERFPGEAKKKPRFPGREFLGSDFAEKKPGRGQTGKG